MDTARMRSAKPKRARQSGEAMLTAGGTRTKTGDDDNESCFVFVFGLDEEAVSAAVKQVELAEASNV